MGNVSSWLSARDALKISELISSLQEMKKQYGDIPVFSSIDWDWVTYVEFDKDGQYEYVAPIVRLK